MMSTDSGPDWASVITAIGTVLVATVAVGVALFADWRTSQRVKLEHKISAQRLREERHRAQEAEQLSEAHLVRVLLAKSTSANDPTLYDVSSRNLRYLVAVVINRGRFAITGIGARFQIGNALVEPRNAYIARDLGDIHDFPEELRTNVGELVDTGSALSARDKGMRFEAWPVDNRYLEGAYAIIRWTDNWGTTWEHRNGAVRQIPKGEEDWKRE